MRLSAATATLPCGRVFSFLPDPSNAKGATLTDHPFFIWWRRREFESSLSLDRPSLRFGHPRRTGASSAVTAAKTKKGHPDGRPFMVFGGGGGSLSFTGLWPVHHAYALLRRPFPSGAGSAVTAAKNKKGHLKVTFSVLWWRRRELNPRPPVLCLWLYMLSFR